MSESGLMTAVLTVGSAWSLALGIDPVISGYLITKLRLVLPQNDNLQPNYSLSLGVVKHA